MITFSAEFCTSAGKSCDDFLKAIELWLFGSPHSKFTTEEIKSLTSSNHPILHREGENIEVTRVETADFNIAGIRYLKSDDYIAWDTKIVFASGATSNWIGAQIEVNASYPASRVPPAKKPIFIKRLLEELGGGQDGALLVSKEPLFLSRNSVDDVADIVMGQSLCRMPVVYISAPFTGQYLISPAAVADRLAGLAHVLVEPDRDFSIELAERTNRRNVYGSTVAIYWPNGGGRRRFYFSHEYAATSEIEDAVVEEIRVALTNRRLTRVLSWENLRELHSRRMIQRLQQSGSTELSDYIATFDAELQAKEDQINSAEQEINRLQEALQRAYLGEKIGMPVVLETSEVPELYPGELRDIVCEALPGTIQAVTKDSRRQHVLTEICRANQSSGQMQELRSRLTSLLRGYNSMDAAIRRGLIDLGFAIDESGGKHYKLTFHGDDRYTFSLPRSGSDHRGGLNAAGDISRLCL